MNGAGRLTGKTALVTGGGGAIGGAIARLFAAEGAAVLVLDERAEAAATVAAAIASAGGRAESMVGDVAEEATARIAVERAVAAFGGLHVLVNVAAAVTPDAAVESLALEDWNRAFAVNLGGAFLMSKHTVPRLRAAGGGAIVNIASQLGRIGVPRRAAYCSTKAAVIHFTTILAAEVARDGIRVNSISPGVIETPRTTRRFARPEDLRAARGPLHMLGRVGQPDEVARAALFLASDDASFTTATDLLVDGGYVYLKRQESS
jgi:NAD(P)-dependent dehydrogenase (short-subunit alcohol dehydrogenase family)